MFLVISTPARIVQARLLITTIEISRRCSCISLKIPVPDAFSTSVEILNSASLTHRVPRSTKYYCCLPSFFLSNTSELIRCGWLCFLFVSNLGVYLLRTCPEPLKRFCSRLNKAIPVLELLIPIHTLVSKANNTFWRN